MSLVFNTDRQANNQAMDSKICAKYSGPKKTKKTKTTSGPKVITLLETTRMGARKTFGNPPPANLPTLQDLMQGKVKVSDYPAYDSPSNAC